MREDIGEQELGRREAGKPARPWKRGTRGKELEKARTIQLLALHRLETAVGHAEGKKGRKRCRLVGERRLEAGARPYPNTRPTGWGPMGWV